MGGFPRGAGIFVIAGLDPAIHHSCERMLARVKPVLGPAEDRTRVPAHDE
jgi:hypothetical protein